MSAGKSEHAANKVASEAVAENYRLQSENALLHQRCERLEREHKALLGENERLRADARVGRNLGVDMTGEEYWPRVVTTAESIAWDDDVRESVVRVHAYLVGTLAQTGIIECPEQALTLPWSFDMHVAVLLHAMTEDGFRGLRK